jgi:hypothetical protein
VTEQLSLPDLPSELPPKREAPPDFYVAVGNQVEEKLAEYASIDRWPTCSLLSTQFTICKCGCGRASHRMIGTQRLGCKKKGCGCEAFTAPIFVAPKRRGR